MSAADDYAKEVHSQLKRYATWLPSQLVKVGMVGQLQGEIFVPVSDLRAFGISVNVVKDPNTNATYKFMSSGTREVATDASATGVPGSAAPISAKLNIAFSKSHSVYFSLTKCVGFSIDNLVDLGNKILKQVEIRSWNLDYVVVTGIVEAGSATIMQAEAKGASVELEGDAPGVPVAELLKVGAAVKVKSQSSVGLSIVASRKLTPLLSLAKVKYTFFDRITGHHPAFSYNYVGSSIALRDFGLHIAAAPNLDFASQGESKNDVLLEVRLPKYGDYVDVADVLDLSAKTAAVRSANSRRPQTVVTGDFHIGTRIPRRRLLAVVDKLPYVDLDKAGSTGDFIKLNVKLPKSGTKVSVEPLFKLAMKAGEPKASATMSAELSFDEIA